MSCNNCFNGCTETVPDQCVKYTGPNVPALGIETGDSLLVVETAIVEFLVPVLTGEGILPIIDSVKICEVVQQYLPSCSECTGFTLNEVLTAIIQATCSLQEQIDDVVDELAVLNAPYDTSCINDEADINGGTHVVLQAVLDKICLIDTAINALSTNLSTNYASIGAELDAYIAAYLSSITTLMNTKMVPYVAVPYFGSLSYFDLTGAGTGNWIKIYLCNGNNPGVPDLRGRVPVGTTIMGSNAFNPAVDPGIAGNPTYVLNATGGVNNVTLNLTQMPSHAHASTAVSTDSGHTHTIVPDTKYGSGPIQMNGGGPLLQFNTVSQVTSSGTANITTVMTNPPMGGGGPHTNIQPVLACHYIIYIP